MSKTLKMSIVLLIVILGFLFLGTEVKAVEVNSKDSLFQALDTQNQTITDTNITLTADIETDIVDFCEYDWVLDLNGHTLTAIEFYVNDGSLTINDTKKGQGKLFSGYTMICEGAKAEINDGLFRNDLNVIDNSGTLTINNGTFHSIWNFGTLTINNGDFANISCDEGTVNINGGRFTAYGFMDEYEGELLPVEYFTLFNIKSAIVTITGGEFMADGNIDALRINGNNEYELDENSINDIMGKGYLAEYTLNEKNCNSWAMSYSSVKVVKDECETILNKIAPNGVWTINAAKPNGEEPIFESESLLTTLANNMDLPKGYKIQAWCNGENENMNTESVHLNICYKGRILLEKDVEAKWIEPSKSVADSVAPVINKIAEKIDDEHITDSGFVLKDLYLINYLNVEDEEINDNLALNFAKDLIELTNGSNMSYEFDFRCGNSGNGLHSALGGTVVVYYNDVPVDTTKIGLNYVNVIYVPNDTADSDEARIAAALKRITDYLGTNNGISMTTGGTLQSITEAKGYYWNADGFFDETTSGTNYYNLTINGKTYKFVVCKKDASELETPKYVGTDVISKISVTSDDKTIPLDTVVTAKKVESDEIKKALGTEVYEAYDITLYSNAKETRVTELENGMFKVSIPVPEKLKNIENLTVYYIDDNGNKYDYNGKVDNETGIATFETNHFSTYAIAEKETYIVTFDGNGGTFKDGKTLTIDKWEIGMEDTLEEPIKDGYKFLGFFTKATGGTKLELILAESGIDENMTFYAQWQEVSAGGGVPGIPEGGEQEENNNTGNTNTGNINIGNTNTGNTNTNKPTGNNPQTGDNIVMFIVISLMAFVGIIVTIKVKKYVK